MPDISVRVCHWWWWWCLSISRHCGSAPGEYLWQMFFSLLFYWCLQCSICFSNYSAVKTFSNQGRFVTGRCSFYCHREEFLKSSVQVKGFGRIFFMEGQHLTMQHIFSIPTINFVQYCLVPASSHNLAKRCLLPWLFYPQDLQLSHDWEWTQVSRGFKSEFSFY